MRRSGEVWKLTSLRDSWFLLAEQLTAAQLDTLIEIFLEVLGEVSPHYDDPDRRWKFDRSPPKQASPDLRRGLSEAVIALGVWPDQARTVVATGYSPRTRATIWCGRIRRRASLTPPTAALPR